MKTKLVPLLGIAFVVAIISTGIFYGLIVNRLRNGPKAQSRQPIVVGARRLERGTVLKSSDLKMSPWAGPEAPKGAFTGADQVAGLTVLESIQEDEPVVQTRLASRKSGGGAALAIPAGMRAVTIRASDSPSVIGWLQAGHKVDVQVVRTRTGPSGNETELRTVLQNLEVLNTNQPEGGQARGAVGSVVTLLAKPAEAEMLGLADSGARIRLIARNPLDTEKPPAPGLNLANLFQHNSPRSNPPVFRAAAAQRPPLDRPGPASPARPDAADRQVLLRVRIAGAGPGALEELGARLLSPRGSDRLQVSAFRAGWDLESAVRGLEVKKQIDILSASHLLTGNNREVSVQAGAHWSGVRGSAGGPGTPAQCGVEIQFMPSIHRDGTLRLRVQPEATSPHGEGVATRRIQTEVELSDGQSFLVTGLFEPGEGAFVLERLFPAHATESRNKELVVLVTPQLVPLTQSSRHTAALMKKP